MAENKIMRSCKALIIGGSAGSLDVLLRIFPSLKTNLPFPVVIVLHRKNSTDSSSSLPDLFSTKTTIPVKEIEDKQTLAAGHIYIAPPDYHVLFESETLLSLDDSEKINYSRPSIDVTFESAAEILGSHLACLLLSGANSDGTYGLLSVKHHGGKALIQDPATADSSYMPAHALKSVSSDAILKVTEMAEFINCLK